MRLHRVLRSDFAEDVDSFHVFNAPSRIFCNSRVANYHGEALGPGDGDIQAIPIKDEFQSTAAEFSHAGAKRQDYHRCFLALEFVDRADTRTGRQPVAEAPNLHVVGCNKENIRDR